MQLLRLEQVASEHFPIEINLVNILFLCLIRTNLQELMVVWKFRQKRWCRKKKLDPSCSYSDWSKLLQSIFLEIIQVNTLFN